MIIIKTRIFDIKRECFQSGQQYIRRNINIAAESLNWNFKDEESEKI